MQPSKETKAEWARRIRGARAEQQLTQAQVAVSAGTTRNTVSAVETGRGHRTSFQVIADALGLDLTTEPAAS